ncbi:MAG: hypothetical protein JWM56_1353 [Candidatus Peribacteria bacterium]|nr:hypothetical protein [Candidatus Peribacteria bacterium]
MKLTRFATLPLLPAFLLMSAQGAFAADSTIFEPAAENSAISLTASVTHDVEPDMINVSVTCTTDTPMSLATTKATLDTTWKKVQAIAKENGSRLRRNGTISLTENYRDPTDKTAKEEYTASMAGSMFNISKSSLQSVLDGIEAADCSYTVDARLVNTNKYMRQYKDQLLQDIMDQKAIYESMLSTKLVKVSSLSFATSADSYYGPSAGFTGGKNANGGYGYSQSSIYDLDTNTFRAVTTLNVTFDFSTGKITK